MPYKTPEERRANYLANRDKQLAQGKEWKKHHRENARASYTKWAKSNPEKVKARRKAHYEKNSEKEKENAAKFRVEHPEKVREWLVNWNKENPNKAKEYVHKRRTKKTQAGGHFTPEEWFLLCFACDFKCLCCKEHKPLVADHIIPVVLGGTSWLWNIQPLCQSCNSKKGTKIIDYRETLGE